MPVFKTILFLITGIVCDAASYAQPATTWLTDPSRNIFFQKQPVGPVFNKKDTGINPAIVVNPLDKFQSIDGFGYALTGGSAMLLMKMNASARAILLKELFGQDDNSIGVSYLRVSIGASDLDELVFSYDDLPAGQTDTSLSRFDLGYDKKYLLPVLKEILRIVPAIKILGSPWSPPAWMKTNSNTKGGNLLKQYYPVYAQYFVRYIQAMRKAGVNIDAVTVQNEPLHPGNNPSMQMFAADQAEFVKDHLGPAFRKAGIRTKIIIYDHNADKPEYPISVLDDAGAGKFIDGSAFHLYGGTIEALSQVHDAHPDKNLYFTEQWVGAPGNFARDIPNHIRNLVIGATRNWSRNVIEWNLAADPQSNPHTDGGCTKCLGAITLAGDAATRNPAYYIIAHASKFVRPGSVRISSTSTTGLPSTAFTTPKGKTVLIVLNNSEQEKIFDIFYGDKTATEKLSAGAVATYVW